MINVTLSLKSQVTDSLYLKSLERQLASAAKNKKTDSVRWICSKIFELDSMNPKAIELYCGASVKKNDFESFFSKSELLLLNSNIKYKNKFALMAMMLSKIPKLNINQIEKFEKNLELFNLVNQNDSNVMSLIADVYLISNKMDKAISFYFKLVQQYPNNAQYKINLLKAFEVTKDSKRMLIQIENDSSFYKLNQLEYLYWKGTALLLKFDYVNAINIFEKLLFEYKDLINKEKLSSIYLRLTHCYIKKEKNDKVINLINNISNVDPYEMQYMKDYIVFKMKTNGFDEVNKFVDKIYKLHKINYYNYYYGLNSYFNKDFQQTILYLKNFLNENENLDKKNINEWRRSEYEVLNSYTLIGYIWHVKMNYDSSIFYYNKAISKTIDKSYLVFLYVRLGNLYSDLKDYKKSDFYFEKACEIDSNNLIYLNSYSYNLSTRKHNLEKAELLCEKLILIDSNNSANLDTYAWVCFQKGKLKKAISIQKKALSFPVSNNYVFGKGYIYEHFGDMLAVDGQITLALEYWQKAKIEGNPSRKIDQKIKLKRYIE